MKPSFFLSLLFILLFSSVSVNAQMFSVGGSEESYYNPFAPYIRAGVSNIDFTYSGDQNIPQENRFDMLANGLFIGFESMGINANLTLANKITGQDDNSFFQVDIMFSNPFPLIRKPTFTLALPLQLSTQYTSVQSDMNSEEFAQTALNAGLGGLIQFRNDDKFSLTTQFVPSYGFSSSSGGFFGGTVLSLDGKARLNFYNLVFGRNISIGFDYKFNSYDIEEDSTNRIGQATIQSYDYDLTKLTFTLGVSL